MNKEQLIDNFKKNVLTFGDGLEFVASDRNYDAKEYTTLKLLGKEPELKKVIDKLKQSAVLTKHGGNVLWLHIHNAIFYDHDLFSTNAPAKEEVKKDALMKETEGHTNKDTGAKSINPSREAIAAIVTKYVKADNIRDYEAKGKARKAVKKAYPKEDDKILDGIVSEIFHELHDEHKGVSKERGDTDNSKADSTPVGHEEHKALKVKHTHCVAFKDEGGLGLFPIEVAAGVGALFVGSEEECNEFIRDYNE